MKCSAVGRALGLVGLWASASPVLGADGSRSGNHHGAIRAEVTVNSARDITRCLRVGQARSAVAGDCLNGKGHAFEWHDSGGSTDDPLTLEGHLCLHGDSSKCLTKSFKLAPKSVTDDIWRWSKTDLRIRLGDECLTYSDSWSSTLALDACRNASHRIEQKADYASAEKMYEQFGAGPADQSWVILPAVRPQIDVLSKIKFPLRASGRYIVDSRGQRVKLAGINWMGAHLQQLVNNGLDRRELKTIAESIKHMGFNSVRMNYALSMTDNSTGEFPPVPSADLVAANPELKGLSALEVFDRCVQAVTDVGLLVILNVHMSNAGWCCTTTDGDGLWFNKDYSTEDWLSSLEFMASRYKDNPRVVGIDLRNEPRQDDKNGMVAWWGVPGRTSWHIPLTGYSMEDWRVAAARGAMATWKGNSDALVIVEGFYFAMSLRYVVSRPLKLKQDCLFSRVVYSNHEYPHFNFHFFDWAENPFRPWIIKADSKHDPTGWSNFHKPDTSYPRFKAKRHTSYMYLIEQNIAPVWCSEFGFDTRHATWWNNVIAFYHEFDQDWCYWPLDPIKYPRGISHDYPDGLRDSFGLYDPTFADYRAVIGWKLQDMVFVQAPKDPALSLPEPGTCVFDWEANREYAMTPTSWGTVLLTTFHSGFLFVFLVLFLLCGCGCLCGCTAIYALLHRRSKAPKVSEESGPLLAAS